MNARRERQHERRQQKVHAKRKAQLDAVDDADEIDRRKASFQGKKARRMARRAEGAAAADAT